MCPEHISLGGVYLCMEMAPVENRMKTQHFHKVKLAGSALLFLWDDKRAVHASVNI